MVKERHLIIQKSRGSICLRDTFSGEKKKFLNYILPIHRELPGSGKLRPCEDINVYQMVTG